jgi:hypothetical protein
MQNIYICNECTCYFDPCEVRVPKGCGKPNCLFDVDNDPDWHLVEPDFCEDDWRETHAG